MKKILVIGSLNMDYSIQLERRPKTGETVKAKEYINSEGGKGANQAYTIGKLGGNVDMIGAVGEDENGNKLKSNLESVNVDISGNRNYKRNTNRNSFYNSRQNRR